MKVLMSNFQDMSPRCLGIINTDCNGMSIVLYTDRAECLAGVESLLLRETASCTASSPEDRRLQSRNASQRSLCCQLPYLFLHSAASHAHGVTCQPCKLACAKALHVLFCIAITFHTASVSSLCATVYSTPRRARLARQAAGAAEEQFISAESSISFRAGVHLEHPYWKHVHLRAYLDPPSVQCE